MISNKFNLLVATLVAVLAFSAPCSLTVSAQGRRPGSAQSGQRPGPNTGGSQFNLTELRQRVSAFITREAGLTQREVEIVFPLFHELKSQQRDLKHRIDNACQRANTERLSERDCQAILTEIQRMQRQFADLESNFYNRLRQRGIPASKILRIKAADEKFRRSTFRQATNGPRK